MKDAEFFFYLMVVIVMFMEGWSDGKHGLGKD